MENKEYDIKKESASQEDSDWTDERMEEMNKLLDESEDEAHKEWLSLSEEEKERQYKESEKCRFWEDFTDVDI